MPADPSCFAGPELDRRVEVARRLRDHLAVNEPLQLEGQRARPLEEEHLRVGHIEPGSEQARKLACQFLVVDVDGDEAGVHRCRSRPGLVHRRGVGGDVGGVEGNDDDGVVQ